MSKITSRGKGSVGCGFTKSAAKFTRCQSTRRPGKPSTTGFLPPILDLILLPPLFPAFGKNKKIPELRHMDRTSVWKLVQARARASGLEKTSMLSFLPCYRDNRVHERRWKPRYCSAYGWAFATFYNQDLRQITGPANDGRG